MILTKSNFRLYAIKAYDNPFCLTESEFDSDLFKSSTIKKMITNYELNGQTNIKVLVNIMITFYNVFKHKEATEILAFKIVKDHYNMLNSLLFFLSLPLIAGYGVNEEFLVEIEETYND